MQSQSRIQTVLVAMLVISQSSFSPLQSVISTCFQDLPAAMLSRFVTSNCMRRLLVPLIFACFSLPLCAATRVSVAQLMQFLASRQTRKEADSDIADQLKSAQLSEELTVQTLTRIEADYHLGPKTIEQLRILADSSIFYAAPPDQLSQRNSPDQSLQRQMVEMAIQYVDTALERLPDFLATRTTDSFDNVPRGAKQVRPQGGLHFLGEFHREIAYRNGQELNESTSKDGRGTTAPTSASRGFTTWGEFGPVLKTVLIDSFEGSVSWSRWQLSETGTQQDAVLRYVVPRSASHYLVSFCCYRKSVDDPQEYSFNDRPGYHGELYLDPETGAIDRITVEADLTEADPVTVSDIAVQYGRIRIAGKTYICPIRSIAITNVRNLKMEADGIGPEKHMNETHFLDYHKFESTFRILNEGNELNKP